MIIHYSHEWRLKSTTLEWRVQFKQESGKWNTMAHCKDMSHAVLWLRRRLVGGYKGPEVPPEAFDSAVGLICDFLDKTDKYIKRLSERGLKVPR